MNGLDVRPGLVIFDCDGVLVDSEPISIAVLREMIAAAGCAIDEQTAYDKFLGRSMASISEILAADFGLAITDEQLDAMRAALYARFRQELESIEGVTEAVAAIPARRCVASSSQPERIRLSLRIAGLLELFEPHLYSATMVARGKPAPDLFLHAAREMGVAPARCVVVEDSPAGVAAGRKAGMRVLAFCGGSHAPRVALRERLAALEPDALFDDMRRLPALVGSSASEGRVVG